MKKNIFYLAIFLFTFQLSAQDNEDEKIESLKTAFITEALSLSPEEAQTFWPLYNSYEEKNESLYDEKWCEVKNGLNTIDELDDATADRLLTTYVSMKEDRLQLRKEFIEKLKDLMSSKRILMLKKAERDFHKLLLEKYKK
jgi:hypothetical protein